MKTPIFATLIITLGLLAFLPHGVDAAPFQFLPDCALSTDPNAFCNSMDDVMQVFANVAQFFFGLTGSVALLMFFWGGLDWILSQGVADKVAKGKKKMTGAVIGIAVTFSALAIVRTVQINLIAAGTGRSPAEIAQTRCLVDEDCCRGDDAAACTQVCDGGICAEKSAVEERKDKARNECIEDTQCVAKYGDGYVCSAKSLTQGLMREATGAAVDLVTLGMASGSIGDTSTSGPNRCITVCQNEGGECMSATDCPPYSPKYRRIGDGAEYCGTSVGQFCCKKK